MNLGDLGGAIQVLAHGWGLRRCNVLAGTSNALLVCIVRAIRLEDGMSGRRRGGSLVCQRGMCAVAGE